MRHILGHCEASREGRVYSHADVGGLRRGDADEILVFRRSRYNTYRRSNVGQNANDVAFLNGDTVSISRKDINLAVQPIGGAINKVIAELTIETIEFRDARYAS